MEEFLKNKAEELDMLISERERIDNKSRKTAKDKADLVAISELIDELSEQLNQNEVIDASKELSDWNKERDYLDNKQKRTKRDRSDIKEINEILKSLSDKLKEISSRKEIEDYNRDKNLSQNKIDELKRQKEVLDNLGSTLDKEAYQVAIDKIDEKIEKEAQILSYNERIISTYNLLKENNNKLNLILELEEKEKEQELYKSKLPSSLLDNKEEILKYEQSVASDKNEEKRLQTYIDELKQLQDERRSRYDLNEVERIQNEINSVNKHLLPLQERVTLNEMIISDYRSLVKVDTEISMLSSKVPTDETKESISIVIENCKRILPENLQKSAVNASVVDLKSEVADEVKALDDKSIELEGKKTEESVKFESKETPKSEDINIEKIVDEIVDEKSTDHEKLPEKEAVEETSDKDKENSEKEEIDARLKSIFSSLDTATADEENTLNEEEEKKDVEVETTSKVEEEKPAVKLKSSEYEEIPPKKNNGFYNVENGMTVYSGPEISAKDSSLRNKENKDSEEKKVTGIRKAFKDIKSMLRSKKAKVATKLVLLSVGVIGVGIIGNNKNTSKTNAGDPDAIVIYDDVVDNYVNDFDDNLDDSLSDNEGIEILDENNIEELDNNQELNDNVEQEDIEVIEPVYLDEDMEVDYVDGNEVASDIDTLTSDEKSYIVGADGLISENETGEFVYDDSLDEDEVNSYIIGNNGLVDEKSADAVNDEDKNVMDTISALKNLSSSLKNNDSDKTRDILKEAFYNSNLAQNMAFDEYSADDKIFSGIREENYDYWTDEPLTFVKDPNGLGTDAYLIKQADENGNLVGMGFTDEETMNNYEEALRNSMEQYTNGRSR